jgi:hypothetical protein
VKSAIPKLGNIQRHIFAADFVESANRVTLENRPEGINHIRVDRSDDVLLFVVVHHAVRVWLVKPPVAVPSIGCEQSWLCWSKPR